MNRFYALSFNYKEFDLLEREKFIKTKPEKIFNEFLKNDIIFSYIPLITCLRVEFYFMTDNINLILEKFKNYKFRIENGENAVNYLFNVICGLDSIILGEEQILSQIKKAYSKAKEENKALSELNTIFNNAISLGKKFRFQSKINSKSLSLESIAFKFIKSHFEDYINKKIFILGIGDLSKNLLKILKKEGIKNIIITNRTYHKIEEIQYDYDVEAVDFHKKYEKIIESDIIISSTSAPHLIIEKEKLKNYINDNKKRCFIDLAVPRDIEDSIIELGNINLYNLNDLWQVYNENTEKRNKISKEYLYLLDEQMKKIKKWFEYKKTDFKIF